MQYISTKQTVGVVGQAILVASLGLALLLALVPYSASAYTTTAQSVTKLSDTATLFQITYRLHFLNRELRVPLLSSRVTTVSTSSPLLQFSLRDAAGEVITSGTTTAVVLSSAAVENSQYYLPESTPGFFTLVALVEHPAVSTATSTAHLQIDWLPFTLVDDGEEELVRVPEAELTPFKTPTVMW